ncbi:MAG: hypothetical protein MPK01_04025 [Gammaproteobacteria bacterium]|nr:hypothetical protein [Gammaproteobacteria bacterium]
MMKITDIWKLPSLKLSAVLFAAAFASGCVTDQFATGTSGSTSEPVAGTTEVITDEGEYTPAVPSKWVVLSGDHLWGIAGVENVYNNPEYWPLLYKSNLAEISDADLIFPGQVLQIERDLSVEQIDAAIQHARTRGAWTVGESEAADSTYVSNSP